MRGKDLISELMVWSPFSSPVDAARAAANGLSAEAWAVSALSRHEDEATGFVRLLKVDDELRAAGAWPWTDI